MKRWAAFFLAGLLALALAGCTPVIGRQDAQALVDAHNRAVVAYDETYELLQALNGLELGLQFPQAFSDHAALFEAKTQSAAALNGDLARLAPAETRELTDRLNRLADAAEGWKPKLQRLVAASTTLKQQFAALDEQYSEMTALFDEVEARELVLSSQFTQSFDAFLAADDALWQRWDTLRQGADALPEEELLTAAEALAGDLTAHVDRLRQLLAWLSQDLQQAP